ncbi:MAG: hypothetical protein QJR02_08315 [Sinobacteraceae bacterium]|nr:hypothetical protein [Nevskiaceae bacterium]
MSWRGAKVSPAIDRDGVLAALRRHVGRERGITARELVREICGAWSAGAERELREIVVTLRREGIAICATPSSGYFVARDDEELTQTRRFLTDRIRTTAEQLRQLNRLARPELNGQRRLML